MSVKQILHEENDSSYRLKNHKSDKGKAVMRRQTWLRSNDGKGLRRHEYRLFSRATFLKPESDGSLSRNEGASLQAYPVIIHYFHKEGGGRAASETRVMRTRKKRGGDEEDDEEEDDDDEDEELELDDDEEKGKDEAAEEGSARGKRGPGTRTRRGRLQGSSEEKIGKEKDGGRQGEDFEMEMELGGVSSLPALGPQEVEEWFGGGSAKRARLETSWIDEDDLLALDDRAIFRESFGLRQSVGDGAPGAIMVTPDTTCAIDRCCPDYAHQSVEVLAVVRGFSSPESDAYDYTASFSDQDVSARLVADGVLAFDCPPHQPGVVNFWLSRRSRATQRVEYTKHLPFFFLPAPQGDGRVSLAWNHLRAFPAEWSERFAAYTKELDLSFNMLDNLDFVGRFPLLNTLVADNNVIVGNRFPHAPMVRHLSLNRNSISDLDQLLEALSANFPNLQHLSLLGNEVCPIFAGDPALYQSYKTKIKARLPNLKTLDERRA